MSATSVTVIKSMSVASSTITPLSPLFYPKTHHHFLSIPSNPKSFRLSYSSLSIPSWVPLKSKLSSSSGSLIALVARTSDCARQNENEVDKEGFDWEGTETIAHFSEWEGEGEGEEPTESGAEEEEGYVAEEDSYSPPTEEVRLFVGNLSYDMESADLAELFNKAGIVETAEVIYHRETDRSRGFGFVTMSTVEEAEKAIEMFNRYEINGRLLTVSKSVPRGSRVKVPSFQIHVGNLPWDVDNTRLEQVFSKYGTVVQARIVYDAQSGRSRGFGFVTFSSQAELDDAIAALDGHSLDGRLIRVSVAEKRPRRDSV